MAGSLVSNNGICLVCKRNERRYTCPKCQVAYCSLDCYKKHNEGCAESFYQQNIFGVLQSTHATEQDKKNILQILSRIRENETTSQEEADIFDRMSQLDLDSPDLFSQLSKEEQTTFMNLIQNGRAGTLISVWEPWWTKEPKKNLVQDMNSDSTTDEYETPVIKRDIPPLTTLISKAPSPFLVNNLVDILYSYAYTLRVFNGEWQCSHIEALSLLYQLSSVLSNNTVYETLSIALQNVLENSLKPFVVGNNTRQFSVTIIEDVYKICKSKDYVLATLSDLDQIFLGPMKKDNSKKDKKHSKSIVLARKKILFYLSWANEMPPTIFEQLSCALEIEFEQHKQNLSSTNNKPPTNLHIAIKPLIEEL